MGTVSLLLPTRQRPGGLQRLVKSINATADDPSDIELVTYIDDDDPSYDNLALDVRWVKVSGPRVRDEVVNLSAMWNECYAGCSGDIVMHCGDDIVFQTPGWDSLVRSAFESLPDRILFAYGRDGIQGPDFGTHGFIHRAWVNAVGYLFPPLFVSDYNDTFLNDVAKQIGRHRLIDIYTEHMHYIAGKAEIDQNTRERLERHGTHRPQDLYASETVQGMIKTAAERLRGAMQ